MAFSKVVLEVRSPEEAKWVEGIKELISIAKDKINEKSDEALSILWELRGDKGVKKRDTAIKALGEVAKTNDEALSFLIGHTDSEYSFWEVAVKALSETAKANVDALKYLMNLTRG